MKRKQISETVFNVIEEHILEKELCIDRNEDMEFGEKGFAIDSLGYLKLIMLLEKIFDFDADDYIYDYNIINTVYDLTEYIYKKRKEYCMF